MAELQPGAKVAKDLGIYLGQIYGYVKRGLVVNHKEGGYPEGKGLVVDPDEVKAAWMKSKKKGPRAPRAKSSGGGRSKSAGDEPTRTRTRRLPTGSIVTYETGRDARAHEAGRPHYTVAQVLGSTGRLTYLDNGNHRQHYNGVQIDNIVFGTDRFSTMLAKGVVHVEHPVAVLGMVLLSFVMEGKDDLAQSLEDWMTEEGLDVIVPEILESSDLVLEDEGAQPVASEAEEEE